MTIVNQDKVFRSKLKFYETQYITVIYVYVHFEHISLINIIKEILFNSHISMYNRHFFFIIEYI